MSPPVGHRASRVSGVRPLVPPDRLISPGYPRQILSDSRIEIKSTVASNRKLASFPVGRLPNSAVRVRQLACAPGEMVGIFPVSGHPALWLPG